MLAGNANLFSGEGWQGGAPIRNDRYSQGLVTIFVRKEYLNTHLSYSKSLLMTLSESELFTGDKSVVEANKYHY